MTCDPNTLSRLSSCIRCLTDAQLASTRTYLLCQWAQKLSGGAAPNAPINPDITAPSTFSNIVVTWTNTTPMGATNEVWKSSDGITFNLFTTVSGGVSQVIDASVLAVGAFAYYKIRSCNGTSCSAFSATISCCRTYTSPNVASISFPTLIRAFGPNSFTASGLAALTSVSLPLLKLVDSNLDLSGNANLTTITLTALQTVGLHLFLGSDKITGAFSLPALVSTGGDIQLQGNTLMTSLSAPLLTTIGGIGSFSGCSGLTSVTLTSLASTGARIDFNSDTSLTSISLPALTTVNNDVVCNGCTLLQSVSLPNLTTAAGNFTCNACPAMTTFSIPAVIFANTFQIFTWNADALLAASVNQILARGVASAVTNADFELSAGTNAAPTGQGVADKATLIGQGNTVVTN